MDVRGDVMGDVMAQVVHAATDGIESPVTFSIANINPGVVRAEFMRSIRILDKAELHLEREVDAQIPRVRYEWFYDQFAGPYLDDERNKCVDWFLNNTTSDYLLFWDSDVATRTPDQSYELIRLATTNSHHLLGGTYFNAYPEGVCPVAYHWMTDDSDTMVLVKYAGKDLRERGASSETGCVAVDAMGTGFMAIHRELLNKIGDEFGSPTPWFAEVSLNGVHLGEDMTFCIRARHCNVQPHIVPSLELDHYKSCVIRPSQDT